MEQDKTQRVEKPQPQPDFNLELARNPNSPKDVRQTASDAVLRGNRIDSILSLTHIIGIEEVTGKDVRFFRDSALNKISERLQNPKLSKPEIIELRKQEANIALQQALEPESDFSWRTRLSEFANNTDGPVDIDDKTRCELRKLAHSPTDQVWRDRIHAITHNRFTGRENDLYQHIMPLVDKNPEGTRTPYSYYAQAVEATIDAEMRRSSNPDYKPELESIKDRFMEASFENHSAYLKSLKQITPEVHEALSQDSEYRTKLAEDFITKGEYHKAEGLMDKLENNDKIRALRTRNYLFMAEQEDATPENAAKYIREAMTSSVALADIPIIGGEGIGKYTRNMAEKYPGQPDIIRPLHILEARNFLGRANPDTDAAGKKIKEALGVPDDFEISNTDAFVEKTEQIADKKIRQSLMLAGIEYFSAKSNAEGKEKSTDKHKEQIEILAGKLQASFLESYSEKASDLTHDNLRLDITDTLKRVWNMQIEAGCGIEKLKEDIIAASDKLGLDIPEIPAIKNINEMEDLLQQEKHKSELTGNLSRISDSPAEASPDDLNFALGHADKIDKEKLRMLNETARAKVDLKDEKIESHGVDVYKLLDSYMILLQNARADEKENRLIPGLINSALPLAQAVYKDASQDEVLSQKIAKVIVELSNTRDAIPEVKKRSFLPKFLRRRS